MTFKRIIIALIVFVSSASVAQAQDINSELEKRFGTQKISEIYNYQYSYYHFLEYEMENGYVIKSKKEIEKDLKKTAKGISDVKNNLTNESFTFSILDSKEFYFLNYSFKRELDKDVVYNIGDGNFIIIYSKQNIAKMYKSKYGETKRTKPSKK